MKINHHKINHLRNSREFYSERESGNNYYHIIPHAAGFYELYMNNEHIPSILVYCLTDKLLFIGVGERKGYAKVLYLKNVQFLDLNFLDESNLVYEDSDDDFTASFDGEEVLLFAGEESKPDRFHIENSLG